MTSVNGRWTGPAGVFPCVRAGLALVVALELAGPALATAQVRVATLDELRRTLGPGDSISVVHTAGDSVSGRLLRLGDTDLDIRADTRELSGQQRHLDITIPLGAIQSLERPRDPLRNGVLIGAAVGAGCGRRDVRLRRCGRPQRDRRVGADSIWHTRPCPRGLAHWWAGRSILATRNRTSDSTGAPRRRPR